MQQDLTDEQLVELFLKGDESAFTQLYERYKTKVAGIIHGMIHDHARAEDLAQEVLLRVYFHLKEFKGKSRFFSWLYRATLNATYNEIRSRKRKPEESLDKESSDPDSTPGLELAVQSSQSVEEIQRQDIRKILESTLQKMPEKFREVLVLCDIEGLTYEEAGKVLNLKANAVGFRLFEARKHFRKIFPKNLGDLALFLMRKIWIQWKADMIGMIENFKLAIGKPSRKLASFIVDEGLAPWQEKKLTPFLNTDRKFRRDWADFHKIKTLLNGLSSFEFSANFDARFFHQLEIAKLAIPEEKRAWTWEMPRLEIPVLRPAVALASVILMVTTASYFYWFAPGLYPVISRSSGVVEYRLRPEMPWQKAPTRFVLKKGMELRTLEGSSADITLKKKMIVSLQEATQIKALKVFRKHQSGEFAVEQKGGRLFVALAPEFHGSSFTIYAIQTQIQAFGTRFFTFIEPSQAVRVAAIEGEVHVRHLVADPEQYEHLILPLDSEALLRPKNRIPDPRPLEKTDSKEITVLKNLQVPGQKQEVDQTPARQALESPFVSVLLIRSPNRVAEFFENPRISVIRGPGRIQELLREARTLTAEAYRENSIAKHAAAISLIEQVLDRYLDSYGHFEPQLRFFLAAYYFKLGNLNTSLSQIEALLSSDFPEWQAQALFARAFILEKLNQTAKALEAYRDILKKYPDSLEAQAARKRLSSS